LMALGFTVDDGKIKFDFLLFDKQEILTSPATFKYWNVNGQPERMDSPAGSVVYTMSQVPVVVKISDKAGIEVHLSNGSIQNIDGLVLDKINSQHILKRDGDVHHLVATIVV